MLRLKGYFRVNELPLLAEFSLCHEGQRKEVMMMATKKAAAKKPAAKKTAAKKTAKKK